VNDSESAIDGLHGGDRMMVQPVERLSARIAASRREVEEWRAIWSQWQWHPNSDIDFYLLILDLWQEWASPLVIQLQENGSPVAMLAGRIERAHDPFQIGYLNLFHLRVRRLHIITGGWMGDTGNEESRRLVSEIRRILKADKIDYAVISNIPADSSLYRSARQAQGLLTRDFLPEKSLRWSMRLPETYSDFLKRRKKKHRYWLNRLVRVLEQEFPGRVKTRCFRAVDGVGTFCAEAEEVARVTYLRRLGAGFINDSVHQKRCLFAAQNNRLRGYVLYVDERPRAFWCGTLYRGAFHLAWTGYDPEWRKYELGTVLFLKLVEDLCAEKVQTIDFGLGEAFYKERFGDQSWEDASVYLYSATARGIAINCLRTIMGLVSRGARTVLSALGLVAKLKTYWRRQLSRKGVEPESA
jgi:hypothetical protein